MFNFYFIFIELVFNSHKTIVIKLKFVNNRYNQQGINYT